MLQWIAWWNDFVPRYLHQAALPPNLANVGQALILVLAAMKRFWRLSPFFWILVSPIFISNFRFHIRYIYIYEPRWATLHQHGPCWSCWQFTLDEQRVCWMATSCEPAPGYPETKAVDWMCGSPLRTSNADYDILWLCNTRHCVYITYK